MKMRMDSQKARVAKRANVVQQLPNGPALRRASLRLLNRGIFSHLEPHRNTKWTFGELSLLASTWVWLEHSTLTGAFQYAKLWSQDVGQKPCIGTYVGFVKSLETWTGELMPLICESLRQRMEEIGDRWRIGRWMPLAVDGSRISAPRTKANEATFCAPNFGKSENASYRANRRRKEGRAKRKNSAPPKPQIWVTMLWHMGLQMPWSWKTGPSNSNERTHLQQSLTMQKFPPETLFCCDAGFTGYDLWSDLDRQNHKFLIRVGGNVRLLKKLGYARRENKDTVYLWPAKHRRDQPPLVLRLLQVKVGKRKVCLVTNVLDEKELTAAEARRLYELRWGVEVQFRTLKQTFERRIVRSRTPQNALVELDWSIAGLWMIQLMAAQEQAQAESPPPECSASIAIAVVREALRRPRERPTIPFEQRLRQATKDGYQRKRSKKARYQPQNNDKPTRGKPIILVAQPKDIKQLADYHPKAA